MKAITFLGFYGSLHINVEEYHHEHQEHLAEDVGLGLTCGKSLSYISLFSGLIVHIIKIAVPLIFIKHTFKNALRSPIRILVKLYYVLCRVEAVNAAQCNHTFHAHELLLATIVPCRHCHRTTCFHHHLSAHTHAVKALVIYGEEGDDSAWH
jgi:hypothetical protein